MSLRAGLSHHIRFHGAFAVGLVAALLPLRLPLTDRILIGADLFFLVYLSAMALWVRGRSGDGLRAHFADADEGGALIVAMALGAVTCSLYAIAQTMVAARHPGAFPLRPVLALAAVPLGWAMVHAVMAFHYARLFYAPATGAGAGTGATRDSGGLDFPGDCPEPGPWDFLYYSFTLGMTAQTSDTAVTTTDMRRVTLAHSVLSFFYNAVIVALAVNAGMALVQGGG